MLQLHSRVDIPPTEHRGCDFTCIRHLQEDFWDWRGLEKMPTNKTMLDDTVMTTKVNNYQQGWTAPSKRNKPP